MLKLCINQGYVPSDCKLDGMLVFLLVGDGKNPCDGCNANCVHRTCKCKNNYTNKEGQKVYSIQIMVEEMEFAESKNKC